jgi:GT2 family glycosyltransferase/SAM-dependent methyltransferase
MMDQSGSNSFEELISPQLSCLFQQPQRLGKPSGWWGHIPFANWLIRAAQPHLLVELGTHHGVSYSAFCEAVRQARLSCRCFAVDHWQGDAHAGHLDETVYVDILNFNQAHYSNFSELIRADFSQALERFADGSIDLLHIDGFHTYEAVARDYQQWRSKLSERGVVLFHDSNVHRDGFGIHQFFAELAQLHPHFEFRHGNGLGLIAYGKQAPEAILNLCSYTGTDAGETVRERFAALGARWESYATQCEMSRSFTQQVTALEHERVRAGQQRADAEHYASTLQKELSQSSAELEQASYSFAQQVEVLEHKYLLSEQQRANAEHYASSLKKELSKTRAELEQASGSFAQQVEVLEHKYLLSEQQRTNAEHHIDNLKEALSRASAEREQLKAWYDESIHIQEVLRAQLIESKCDEEQIRNTLAINQATADIQAQRLADDLSLRSLPRVRPNHLRRLLLRLRWGNTRRNPIADVVRRSTLFDAQWYLKNNIDVAHARIEPAFHYAVYGGTEGRNPSPWFSSLDYLLHNPDVAQSGINPLYHYEMHGRMEGRSFPIKPLLPDATATINIPSQETDIKTTFRMEGRQRLQAFLAKGEPLHLPTQEPPLISIIIVLHNQAELTFMCLESLCNALDVPAEVLIIDNASTDLTHTLLSQIQGCRVFPQPDNLHFLRAANLGAAQANGRYLLFLNNDTLLKPGAIKAAIDVFATRMDVGAVGGKIIQLDGSLQEAGSIIWQDGSCQGYGRGCNPQDSQFQFRRDVDYCSGAFFMVPRTLFNELSGFDTAYTPAYYEEVDFCIRLRQAGYAVIYEPRVEVVHVEFGSSSHSESAMQLMRENQKILLARHQQTLNESHAVPGTLALHARMRPSTHKRILLIDDQVPIPSWGSGYPRAREILHTLQQQGAFTTILPMVAEINFDFEEAYSELPRDVEIATEYGRPTIAPFLRSRRDYYDAIIVSRPHNMAALAEALEREPDLLGRTRLIYDAEAIFAKREALKANVLGYSPSANEADELSAELRLAKYAQTIFAVNPTEAQHFIEAGHSDVQVLGHSIDLQATVEGYDERQGLLFVGRLSEDDSPNADSIKWFVQQVMPELDRLIGKDYRLNIIGNCSQTLRKTLESKRVIFHGRIPNIHHFYAKNRLFIAPTRFSAGIPLKIYEAAAHGVPVITTPLLSEQLGWSDGCELLSASSAQAFAQACARLYLERPLWEQVREKALQRVRQDCSPQTFARTLQYTLNNVGPAQYSATEQDYITKVSATWGQPSEQRLKTHGMNWLEHPRVLARLNCKLSGDPNLSSWQYLQQYLQKNGWQLPVARAASLGCGHGSLERHLATLNIAKRIDGYDLASGAIAECRKQAAILGMESLHYHIANLERLEFPENSFDLIFASHSIHHMDDLDGLFERVKHALRPGGVFYIHEYIGPDRFQWTDHQLKHINAFIASMPSHYNCLPDGTSYGLRNRPSVEDVIAQDPSEAICSSQIAEKLSLHFKALHRHDLGGALLHLGLSGIAQNFSTDRADDIEWLEKFFELEDRLMAEGEISSDFAIFIAVNE